MTIMAVQPRSEFDRTSDSLPTSPADWDNVDQMAVSANLQDLVGLAVDRLDLATREAVVGKVVAHRIYTPQNLALQRIAAIGDSVRDCANQLEEAGKDPLEYEFSKMNPPFLAR